MKLFRRLAGSHREREEVGLPSGLRMLYQDMHNAAMQRRYIIGDQDVIKQKLPMLIERCQLVIAEQPHNGDAYAAIADAYFMASRVAKEPEAANHFLALTAAVLNYSTTAELKVHKEYAALCYDMTKRVAFALGLKLGKEGRLGDDQVHAVQMEMTFLREQLLDAALGPTDPETIRQRLETTD